MERQYLDNAVNRFWSKVIIPSDPNSCWIWKAATDKDGYGKFKVKVERKGLMVFRNIGAHSFIWQYYNGEKPKSLIILHSCDNPSCVNPSHLKCGTHADNSRDRDLKGRSNHARGEKLSSPGEENPNHKLAYNQVDEIRERYANGGITQQKLADEYNVTQTTISRIVLNKNWYHSH